MVLINVSELMTDPDFVQIVKLKTVEFTTVNYVPQPADVTVINIFASVQQQDKTKLNPSTIDWSRDYRLLHSAAQMTLGQFFEWAGSDYKIIQLNNSGDNGYYEVVGEETKAPLLI